jgi:GNAT superfamily N-acetyltransferase
VKIEVSIEDFNINQFDKLVALFGSYFAPDDKLLTKSYTEWLYAKNPFGLARMVKAVDVDSDRWVGFMALIPVHLIKRDASLVAYYVVNVLVHPEYHGKHIFGRLITAAKILVENEIAALMGHPNNMAMKSWQRARMHFHEPLRPNLVVPKLPAKGVRVYPLVNIEQLQPVLPALSKQALLAERWCIAVTAEYISWRYMKHPTNKYLIQLIEVNGVQAGFLVSKKVRPAIRLLVDQFMLDEHSASSFSKLPWLTVTFKTVVSAREYTEILWSLPFKKQLPFFFTHYQQPAIARDVMNLGLSASDF